MTTNLDRTTAAVLAADQAHLTRMHEDATWRREGLLDRLVRGERRAAGWRRLFPRRALLP
jgi:hypothetical protein